MRILKAVVPMAALLAAVAVTAQVPASASAAGPVPPAHSFAIWSMVDAVSARDVWAAGGNNADTTVFEHWNGKDWHKIPSPPTSGQIMTASSADNLWAQTETSRAIEHWNGRSWKLMSDGYPFDLDAMAAISGHDVWGVGQVPSGRTLILHWNGRAWRRVPSPDPGGGGSLMSIDMLSATSGWAVGQAGPESTKALALRWNGRSWLQVPVVSPAGPAVLTSVDASSPADVWAIGTAVGVTSSKSVILRWNGASWQESASPSVPASGYDGGLHAVAAISATDAWAAGWRDAGELASQTPVFLRWNGKSWQRIKGPKGIGAAVLSAVSRRDIWAVGSNPSQTRQVIVHWNGSRWKTVLAD